MQLRLASSGKLVRVDTGGCQSVDEMRCRVAVELGCEVEQIKFMMGAYVIPHHEDVEKLEGLDIRIVFRQHVSVADNRPPLRLQKSMFPEPHNYYEEGAMKRRHDADLKYKSIHHRVRGAAGDVPRRLKEPTPDDGWAAIVRRIGAGSAIERHQFNIGQAAHTNCRDGVHPCPPRGSHEH